MRLSRPVILRVTKLSVWRFADRGAELLQEGRNLPPVPQQEEQCRVQPQIPQGLCWKVLGSGLAHLSWRWESVPGSAGDFAGCKVNYRNHNHTARISNFDYSAWARCSPTHSPGASPTCRSPSRPRRMMIPPSAFAPSLHHTSNTGSCTCLSGRIRGSAGGFGSCCVLPSSELVVAQRSPASAPAGGAEEAELPRGPSLGRGSRLAKYSDLSKHHHAEDQ